MDMLIILTYTAICVVIFKVFKVPLNKWTVPTAALGGIALISALMLVMNYNHPYAKYAKEVFVTVPIIPQIPGIVETVNVVPNQKIKQGDVLFTLENSAQTIALKRAEAALEDEKSRVQQKDAALQSASAKAIKAKAKAERTRLSYQRYEEGHATGGENSPFSLLEMDNRKKLYEEAVAEHQAALAEQKRLELIAESKIAGKNTVVAQLIEERNRAQLDLDRTIVKAPSDGTVIHVGARAGNFADARPFRPVMTFIPKEKRRIAARFWQNSLLRMEVGLEAEVILDAAPGHVFKGRVVALMPAMAEGEYQINGNLLSADRIRQHGFAIGLIELEEDLNDYNLPLGVQGQAVALNYEYDYVHVSAVRRILLRMMAWLKYVYPIK